MDVSLFYKDLFEYTLGLDVLGLECRYRDLVKIVDQKTLLAFGNQVPAYFLTYLDLSDESRMIKKELNSEGAEYVIDDPILDKFNLPILGIENVSYSNLGTVDPYDPESGAYYNSILVSRNNLTLESVLFGSEYTYDRTLIDTSIPYKRYKELRGDRVLYLRNWGFNSAVVIKIKTKWPNVVSIPEEYREAFTTLAKYDMQVKLWNELKYMEDVITPTGNLQLKVDWSSAEKDREEFLERLRQKSLPDRIGPTYFKIL